MSDQVEQLDEIQIDQLEPEEVHNAERYSHYSEGDQYDSDEGPDPFDDKNNVDRKPFKQIQIDYQHFQPISILPPGTNQETNEEIQRRKIEQYQMWLVKQQIEQQTPTQQQLTEAVIDTVYQLPLEGENVATSQSEETAAIVKANIPAQSTQLTSGYQVSQEELSKLVYPWTVQFDQTWNKNYYFNGLTNESQWELPPDIIAKVQDYRRQFEHRVHDFEERNMYKFLPKTYIHQQRQIFYQKREKVLQRPARKQVEESIATKYAYRQGDEEYNIWFDKFLSDGNKYKDRDAALTKCVPEADSGYTKADLYEKFSSFFCLHFTRGCCVEGVNCRYYHRIPTLQECEQIDLSKDIFGRSRYQKHREDMTGIGVFSQDTKSVYVTHYKLPKCDTNTQSLAMMYEILWRHFSAFGDVDDINILQAKGVCFLRFKHRCQAEYAKEAMQAQALDESEILTIKWANDDPNPKAISRETEERKQKLLNAYDKNKKRQAGQQNKPAVRDRVKGDISGKGKPQQKQNQQGNQQKKQKQFHDSD